MNKLELISALKKEANMSKAEAAKVIQLFFDHMSDAWQGENALKFVVCAVFMLKNTKATRAETQKPGKKFK